MKPVQLKICIIIALLILSLASSIATSKASNQQSDQHNTFYLAHIISVFIQFAGTVDDDTINSNNITDPSFQESVSDKAGNKEKIIIEVSENYTHISNSDNISIRTEKLNEKPVELKEPQFKPLLYLDIHPEKSINSSAVIRIFNEWQRIDLIIYHYKDNDWQQLDTILNGDYLEAVTESFSIFAVGAPGGINLRLQADSLILSNDTVTVAGAAYYNNSTVANAINVELNPSWALPFNIITDQQGNFFQTLSSPELPGNYSIYVNASSGVLSGSNNTTIQVTNATIYRINATSMITNNLVVDPFANISFPFPEDAVPELSNISLNLNSSTRIEVKLNNITLFNSTTSSSNLNITGYLSPQNEISITANSPVNLTYTIYLGFHKTAIAQVTKTAYYSAALNITNAMTYDWSNSGISYHIPAEAYDVTVWENSSNITGSSIVSGDYLRINSGIGKIYNNSTRNFKANYNLKQLYLNITLDREEIESGETVYITPGVYFNGSMVNTNARVIIYRDSVAVYDSNISSGTTLPYSDTIAGVYNITAYASMNIDGVERTGSNRTYIHIKDLLIYANADPALTGRLIKITGRAYYTNNTGYAGLINISTGNESYIITSNATGFFIYYLPGRKAGTYTISATASAGNYIASANSFSQVLDNYFFLAKGDLPLISSDVTLAPDATLWINQTNITRASLYLYCKTAIHLLYDPLPITHKLITTPLNSYISGTFNLPLYPYDYLEILGAYLNTTAEEPVNLVQDFAFNLTIDDREVNSLIIPHGDSYFTQSDNIRGFIPDFLKPGNTQTIKVFNKNTGSSQQYYFTEELYVDYIGHISSPCDLFLKMNNNFTYANVGNFTNATVDITGFRAASNNIKLNNCRRTSIIGYNITLQKQFFGNTTHSSIEETGRYNITDTAIFAPGSNLTSVTIIIPLVEQAKDVLIFVNGTNLTGSADISENLELFLPEVNSTKVINITYWTPTLDFAPSVNKTQFNRGDTAQVNADITYLGQNVTDAVVYTNISKAGAAVANITLNNTFGGSYLGDYTLSSGAELGVYNITVWAYNATTAMDSENTSFMIRGLNVTANAGGPYIVDSNASVSGYVKDLENNSNISGASVNITIWNSTFYFSTATTSNSTGYYNLKRPVDAAGDYNITVTAFDNNIRGTVTTAYKVKYNISIPVQSSYNKNSSVPVTIIVYDRSQLSVPGVAVNCTVNISNWYFYYNGITDIDGMFNFTHNNTGNYGKYNITVNVSKDNIIGNASTSFRIKGFNVTVNAGGPYVVDKNASISGYVKDIENNTNINGASVNITIWNSTFNYNTATSSNSTGYYKLVYPVDNAGDYNVFVTASFGGINGTANTTYRVKYNVSVTIPQDLYNKNSSVPATIVVYDRSLLPVPGVAVRSTVNISNQYFYYNGTTGQDGMFYFTHNNTGNYGKYNITANVSKDNIIGNGSASFQISALIVAANTQPEYKAGNTVVINGTVIDGQTGTKVTGAIVNVTLENGSIAAFNNTTTIAGNYSVSFAYLSAGVYTAYVDVTYAPFFGSATKAFDIHYNVNTSIHRSIIAVGEEVPVNITVSDVNSQPAESNISLKIRKPDSSVENIYGSTVNGLFNSTFMNTTIEGDYTIIVNARNDSTSAHGDAVNRSFRASGFFVNASLDRNPVSYKPGETVNIEGSLRDSLGSWRVADVSISINNSTGTEVANTILYSMNGSYLWNYTLAGDSVSGWYTVTVTAITAEGVVSSTTTQFEVQLNLDINAGGQYNPDDGVNITIFARNGTASESADVNVTVQKIDIWNDFDGTYFNMSKMTLTIPDLNNGYYLNFSQNNELVFYTQSLTPANTWVGKAVMLNTTILPSRFILDYETTTSGTSNYLLTRPAIGNSTNYVVLNFINYSDNSQDGYDVYTNSSGTWTKWYSKRENTNDRKVHFTIEYNLGTLRFYKNHEQFYQFNYTLPQNSVIKLNGYAQHPTTGTSGYLKFDNVTLYDPGSPVQNQGIASGSQGNYIFNFTAGSTGMYRINAEAGNSSAYTSFLVRTLNVTSVLYGPYNFNESTLSNNTIVPLIIQGTVQDTETRAGISGAQVNISILQNDSIYAYRVVSSNSGNYSINFTEDLNSTAVGIFNISVNANDNGILAFVNNSLTAYTINQSWFDPYRDYRVPVLLYNNNLSGNQGTVTFNIALPGGYAPGSVGLYDMEGNIQQANIIDMGTYINITFSSSLRAYEGKTLYIYFERPNQASPHSYTINSLSAPYNVANGTIEGYALNIDPDRNAYSAGENVVLASQIQDITGNFVVTDVTTSVYYPNGTLAQVNYTLANDTGVALVNYTIPALKGIFTAVASAAVNGVMRLESTNFNVGDITVLVDSDKTVYNTLEKVIVTVNASESGNITAMDVILKIYDPDNVKVFEETKNTIGSLASTINSQGSVAWQYAGSDIPLPGSGNWVIAASNEKNAISSNDSNIWETRRTTGHDQYDYQMYRFQFTQPVDKIINLSARWIGYGESAINYDVSLYIWNNFGSSWEQLDTAHLASEGILTGEKQENISNYVDSNGFVYVSAAARHNDYKPVINSYSLNGWGLISASASDQDGDTVEYFYRNDNGNSGWTTTTSWNGGTPGCYAGWTYYVKARANGIETAEINVGYIYGGDCYPDSCPFVYTWNGTGYEYVTDLGGLGLGSARAITGTNYNLYYVIPATEMISGKYNIRIKENLAESDFFDYLKLIIADVPEGYSVYNTFQSKRSDGWQWHIDSTSGIKYNAIENDLITFNNATTRTPITAYNNTGVDVADRLANIDNYPVEEAGQQKQEYILDFGTIEHPEYAKLLLWSWTYFNTTKQNVPMTLYVINSTGNWEQVADLGVPTGDLRSYAYNISNIWKTSDMRIKLLPMYKPATMNIIDKIALDDSAPVTIEKTVLNVTSAVLQHSEGVNDYKYPTTQNRFLVGDIIPDKKNYYQYGNYTKYGEVSALLSDIDDKFVAVRHGDELSVSFEESAKQNNNINRVFILDSLVYYVMVGSSTGHIDNINLLPFRNMSKYPYSTGVENYPYDEEHNQYLREWNTRVCDDIVGGTCYDSSTGEQIINAKSEKSTEKLLPRSLNTNYIEVTAAVAVPIEFNYTLPVSPPGKYTVTASASKTGNAGYNSTFFELDRFDINASTIKSVYSSGENIKVSGTTIYRGSNSNANVNLTVKKNLAYTPSFETDIDNNAQPDGWIFAGSPWNGTGIRDTVSRTGSYSIKVRRYPANTTEGSWYYPNMSVISPDTKYEFSVWAKTDNITGGSVRLWVLWYNGTVPLSTALNTQQNIRAQDGWILIHGEADSPVNSTTARVYLVSNIIGSVWFDDVNIEPENNPVIYTANTGSIGLYNFSFSLLNESSYIVYANGSFAANGTLHRINTTIITVRSLDVNATASSPLNPGVGRVNISGYVIDKSTRIAVPGATVSINITCPDGTLLNFAKTSNTSGYYNHSLNTPSSGGTYLVNITAKDYQNITGATNTTFRVRLNLSIQTGKKQYDPGETAQITINVNDNIAGVSGATLNLTVRSPSGTSRLFSTLYGNITEQGNGIYTANYPDTQNLGNYTINASALKTPDDGFATSQFNVKSLNVTIQGLQATVGESKSIYARVEDGITHATINNALVNITISNETSVVNQTNTTSGNSSYNIVTGAYVAAHGKYNVTINVTDQNNTKGSARMTYKVNLGVGVTLNKKVYDPDMDIFATIAVRESLTSVSDGAEVVTNLTNYNGTVISSNIATTNSSGTLLVNFKAPGDHSSYFINVTASKNGINGTASILFASSNIRIWTDQGEAIIGSSAWAANAAPEKYRNITIKVAVLESSGMRTTGQTLTAKVYKPDGTLFGTYNLQENDKIYSASIIIPGNNIPEGIYTIRVAEYPGIEGNFSVIMWGCAQCHGPYAGVTVGEDWMDAVYTHSPNPSTFNINHNHPNLANSCGDCHGYPEGNACPPCHTNAIEGNPGITSGPTQCKTCHYSPGTNQGYLNTTYGSDLHASINTKPGGEWYGKSTACESCHGILNRTQKANIPLCTNCHPNSSGSDMKVMPGGLHGSNATLEDFEDISDVFGTSGYRYSTVSLSTNTNSHSGSNSAKVEYGFGPGYGRIYIEKKNLGLTNATKIILWVYGDNSGNNLSISLNNTRSSKISWHNSVPIRINWVGWRKISFNINELSQSDLMYISFADTVRIKLESTSELGGSGTIFIDDLIKEAVGSHTQYDEVECGVCHGEIHNIERAPQCQDCHQTQEHGWPTADKYQGDNASCMQCHQADSTQNRIEINNISEHTELLEDFENASLFTDRLTYFSQSDEYYSGPGRDEGNHSARLDYTGLTGYLGNSINVTDAGKFKGISIFVNASNDPDTKLVFGVYTTKWNNYTIDMDWNGWKQINVLYHNVTVNESVSFNATGTPSMIWMGVYGTNGTGTLYFDDLHQAVSDDYHQYESWNCTDCHIRIKNLPGITDITSPITDCSICHNQKEPHYKQFTRVCMDCHFDSRHAEVEDGNFTNYEKASTCLKCHTVPHDFNQTHLETADCNQCHQQRIHGQNYQNVAYNQSLHLDCERCHGKTTAQMPLPMGLGSPRTTILRLSYTYNNETQCLFCHKDSIVSYELHINTSVNRSDQALVGRILNDSICTDCHGTKSLLIESDRDELTAIDPMREPHAPQIEGHGNVSCYKCHGHRPETLTLNYGSNCVGCHQNMNELTELMPGTMNNSRLSNVTNPGAKQLIVHPPQVTGHGNASCSNCHGHVNSNLTYVGSKASDCRDCHENLSMNNPLLPFRQPNSTRSTITNPGGNPLNVIPPQVLGHGNTSCRECHEHAPSTFNGFDFIEGMICEDCHQNMSRNVSLIDDSVPNSNRTKLVDNHTAISPQVAGHGATACSVCHSHSAERMVYYGGRNTDCITCHFNESSGYTLLRNGSSEKSTQITPHQDMNCTECHGHTPSNMTRVNDCKLCHQNSTMAQLLSDTYGTGLNMTTPGNNITAFQVPFLQHSNSGIAGRKWNKTVAYWVNGSDSCQYCHRISVNYSDHDPLGRASAIAGNNTKRSNLAGSSWCAACHYQGYSSGNVTYNDVVNTYLEAGLPVPPEITSNSSYGNYSISNDGVKYYTHGLSDYSDSSCARCHGHAGNSAEFLHSVTGGSGGDACLSCHDNSTGPNDDPDKYPAINVSLFNNHKKLNNTNGSNIIDDSDCIVCHYNTTDMDKPGWTTPAKNCIDCHINGSYSASEIDNHRQGGLKISTNVYCSICHINSINEYNYSINASISHYGTNTSLVTTVNQTPKPKFGFISQQEANQYNRDCNNCHNPSNPGYGNATLITMSHIGRGTCNECHVNSSSSADTLHNISLEVPVNNSCLACHTTYADKYGAPNMIGTPMAGYTTSCRSSGTCHGTISGINRLDTLSKHNVDMTYPGTGGSTDIVYLNNRISLAVTKGTIVNITSRVNDTKINGGASRIGGAEYYIGTDPGQGKGTAMAAVDGSYDSLQANWENVTATLDTSSLSGGTYVINVRGMDIGRQWSAPRNATLIVQAFGYINGTVTNGTAPVFGVNVSTEGDNDITKPDGTYSLVLPEGNHTVIAGKQPEYYDYGVSGMIVTPLNTTILNMTIQEKPTGTISGVVRND